MVPKPLTEDQAVVLASTLASIVVHTTELLEALVQPYPDAAILQDLLTEPVLEAWRQSLDPALLPVRR
jgi:hypothetical protein